MISIDAAWVVTTVLISILLKAASSFHAFITRRLDRIEDETDRRVAEIYSGRQSPIQPKRIEERLADLRLGPSEEELRERELDRILAEDDRKFPPPSDLDRRS